MPADGAAGDWFGVSVSSSGEGACKFINVLRKCEAVARHAGESDATYDHLIEHPFPIGQDNGQRFPKHYLSTQGGPHLPAHTGPSAACAITLLPILRQDPEQDYCIETSHSCTNSRVRSADRQLPRSRTGAE